MRCNECQPLEGNHEAVAPGENEFDTPALRAAEHIYLIPSDWSTPLFPNREWAWETVKYQKVA